MALFLINNKSVKKIPPIKIGLERDIQKIFEDNLDEILNIVFLSHEYSTGWGGRIDTLGIDNNGAPVIIEYKRNQNDNVINQGLSYLRWLLDHKADFEVLAQKSKIKINIDWSSPRVICIAESYNKFDLDTADLLPVNIELLKYKIYENNILLVELETQQKVRISTSRIFEKKEIKQLKEKVQYSINDHLKNKNKKARKLFEILREKIKSLDETINEDPKKYYIAYKITTNFVDVEIMKNSLKLTLNVKSGELDDPHKITRDLTKPKKIGHLGNGDYEVKLEKKDDIEKIFFLIKQSYNFNK